MILISIYSSKSSSNNEYFYTKTLKKLFNIFNRKKLIKISNSQNEKKIKALIKKLQTFYL